VWGVGAGRAATSNYGLAERTGQWRRDATSLTMVMCVDGVVAVCCCVLLCVLVDVVGGCYERDSGWYANLKQCQAWGIFYSGMK
jgi:hypothetical protein